MSDEKRVAARLDYYQRNKERIREKANAWYRANSESKKEYNKRRRKEDPERIKKLEEGYKIKIFAADPARYMWRAKRSGARTLGIEFSITKEDIKEVLVDVCPVLGIPLEFNMGKRDRHNYNSYSIDRIDSSKGYVKGNIQVMSKRANTLKSDATLEELEKLVAYMRKQQGDK
jgi:hypothetical protein